MKIAIVGCGYVAQSYAEALPYHGSLELAGAHDRDALNRRIFCGHWRCREYASLDELAADPSIEMVLNLTNPRSHYEVTKRCLEAGKHVYSEKPLAMTAAEALELVEIARARGLYLAGAPCSVLSETARTLGHALRAGAIGKPRLVYANFEDGMIAPNMAPWTWRNGLGVPWPAKDEFETGCTFEHAGYVLTWLAAYFGPARHVTSFASCQIPDKGIAVERMAPDFTVGCIEYDGGLVARVTCGLVAPEDKSLTIVGDGGVLTVRSVRNELCPVHIRMLPPGRRRAKIERSVGRWRARLGLASPGETWRPLKRYPFVDAPPKHLRLLSRPVDFCRGPAEMANAIRGRRRCRLSSELSWHVTELIEALQYPPALGGRRKVASSFPPIDLALERRPEEAAESVEAPA